jgi:hypothetical protein
MTLQILSVIALQEGFGAEPSPRQQTLLERVGRVTQIGSQMVTQVGPKEREPVLGEQVEEVNPFRE